MTPDSDPAAPPPTDIAIRDAICRAIFVFDVGREIDLASCRRLVAEYVRSRPTAEPGEPVQLRVSTPALRLHVPLTPFAVEGREVDPVAEVSIYDFGAVAVTLSFPAGPTLAALSEIAGVLPSHPDLRASAMALVTALVERIGAAVERLALSDMVEDYLVFEIAELISPGELADAPANYGQDFARILRAERGKLSRQEVMHATSTVISRTPSDLVIVDWNAALVFHERPEEVRVVLELANAQVLEMRFLDRRLDEALRGAYSTMTKRNFWSPLPNALRHSARHIAQRQIEAAMLFERAGNTLKLVGDQYLARLYRETGRRFDLATWNAANLHKISTLESIYSKVHDLAMQQRGEFLDWIVIALVIVSIVLPILMK